MNNEALYMLLNDDLKKNNTEKEKKIEFYSANPNDIKGGTAVFTSNDFMNYCKYGVINKRSTVFDCDITIPGSSSVYDAKIVRILTYHCYGTRHYHDSIIFYIHPVSKQLQSFSMSVYLIKGGYFIEKRDDDKTHIICYGLSSTTGNGNVSYIYDFPVDNNSGTLTADSSTTIQTSPAKPTYANLYNNFWNMDKLLVSRFVMTSTHMYLYYPASNTVLKHSRSRTDAASDWESVTSSSLHPGTNYAGSLKHRIKIVHDETNNETYEYYISYSQIGGSRYIINAIELYKSYYIDNNKTSSMILRITDDSYFNKLSDSDTYNLSTMIEVSVDYDNIKNSYIFIEPNIICYNKEIKPAPNLINLPIRVVYKIEGDKWYKLNRDRLDALYTGQTIENYTDSYYMYPATRKSMEYIPIVIDSNTLTVITANAKGGGTSYPYSQTLYYEEKEV